MSEGEETAGGAVGEIRIRAMRASDLEAAYNLSVAVHWPHRLTDWRFAFKLGSGVVAETEGRIVGTAMAWKWGSGHATVGLVIVDTALRKQHIAHRLLTTLFAGLHDCALLLHTPQPARPLYERLGFVGSATVAQHQGIAKPAPLVALDAGWRLRPVDHNDLPQIVALDARARGFERAALIGALKAEGDTIVLDYKGEARGFAILRRFGRGRIIGPVVAPDLAGAKALIAHLVGLSMGKFLRIDVGADLGLADWLEKIGLLRVDAVTAMMRPLAPPAAQAATDTRTFALVSQAFG